MPRAEIYGEAERAAEQAVAAEQPPAARELAQAIVSMLPPLLALVDQELLNEAR